MLSIIIPTLNEEKYLPRLLESIKKQNFDNYELIVADGGSTDSTVSIALSYGAKVVDGYDHPGKGRNSGAKYSKGDMLLFLDADVILPKEFLMESLEEFEERFLNAAVCKVVPISDKILDKFMHSAANMMMKSAHYLKHPRGGGFCIFATKRAHRHIKGFDENMKMCEDHDYLLRISKLAKVRMLDTFVYISVRRLDKEGRGALIKKYAKSEVSRVLHKCGISMDVDYEFGKYK